MVQVGNETTNSICGEKDWDRQVKLYQAGSKAVRDVDKEILVAIHVETPDKAKYDKIAGDLKDSGVEYDVFASSYYPFWHCSTADMKDALENIVTKYGKKVMIAEVSWPFTLEDGDGTGNNAAEGTVPLYDFSPQGQADAVSDVVKAMTQIGDDALGIFWWEPAWIPPQYAYNKDGSLNQEIYTANRKIQEEKGSGWASSYAAAYDTEPVGEGGGSSWDNQAWFDFNGRPLASLNMYKYLKSGAVTNRKIVGASADGDVSVAYGTAAGDVEKLLPGVTIHYNYGGNAAAAAKDVTWHIEEIKAALEKGAGTYPITGDVKYQDGAGRTFQGTVSFTLTVEYNNLFKDYNGSFEKGLEGWKVDGTIVEQAKDPNGDGGVAAWLKADDAHDGESSLHYNKSEEFTVSQEITLKAGTYVFGGYLQGGDNGTDDLYELFVQVAGQERMTASAVPTGWAAWKKVQIKEIVVPEGGVKVTFGIHAIPGKNAWGTWDDLYLFDAADMADEPDEPDEPENPGASDDSKLPGDPASADNLLKDRNYGFEENTFWNITGTGADIATSDPHSGNGALHFYSDGAFSFEAAQTIVLDAGEYFLAGYLQGGDNGADDVYELYLKAGDKEYKASAVPAGWGNWQVPQVSGIVIPKDGTEVTVGIRVTGSPKAWGTWDDIALFRISGGEEQAPEQAPVIGNQTVSDVVSQVKEKAKNSASGGKKETVSVNMKKADGTYETKVPQEILAEAKGSNVDLVFDMGAYRWTINGKDIKDAKDVNLEVKMNTKAVPEKVVSKLAGKSDAVQFSLSNDGAFGFKASLTITLDKKYAGQYGNLYYYNNGSLEPVQAGRIAKNGTVTYTFEHASDYVIVIDKENRINAAPATGDHSPVIPFAVLLIAAAGMTGVAAFRRHNCKNIQKNG